jgi:hypothetical protein
LLVAALAWPAAAAAAPCGRPDRPWVGLTVDPQDAAPLTFDDLLLDLRAELGPRGIEVCAAGTAGADAALATFRIALEGPDHALVRLEIRDEVTQKWVGRRVDLSKLPPDGRALAVAVAADELLRATWAELVLVPRQPRPPPPPQVEQAVGAILEARPRAPPATSVRGAFAVDRYTGGQTHLGVDVGLSRWLGPRIGLDFALGLRAGLPVSAPHGTIHARVEHATAGILLALVPRRLDAALELSLAASARGMHVDYQGVPDDGASGTHASGWALYALGGVSAALHISPALCLGLSLGAGAPLRSSSASDGDRTVTGISGLGLSGSAGAGASF